MQDIPIPNDGTSSTPASAPLQFPPGARFLPPIDLSVTTQDQQPPSGGSTIPAVQRIRPPGMQDLMEERILADLIPFKGVTTMQTLIACWLACLESTLPTGSVHAPFDGNRSAAIALVSSSLPGDCIPSIALESGAVDRALLALLEALSRIFRLPGEGNMVMFVGHESNADSATKLLLVWETKKWYQYMLQCIIDCGYVPTGQDAPLEALKFSPCHPPHTLPYLPAITRLINGSATEAKKELQPNILEFFLLHGKKYQDARPIIIPVKGPIQVQPLGKTALAAGESDQVDSDDDESNNSNSMMQ